MTHDEYVEYSELLTLTWAFTLVGVIGWVYGFHGVLTSASVAVETVDAPGMDILRVQTGWLAPMMIFVLSSAILLKCVKLRGLLKHHPGAATPGEDGVEGE